MLMLMLMLMLLMMMMMMIEMELYRAQCSKPNDQDNVQQMALHNI